MMLVAGTLSAKAIESGGRVGRVELGEDRRRGGGQQENKETQGHRGGLGAEICFNSVVS